MFLPSEEVTLDNSFLHSSFKFFVEENNSITLWVCPDLKVLPALQHLCPFKLHARESKDGLQTTAHFINSTSKSSLRQKIYPSQLKDKRSLAISPWSDSVCIVWQMTKTGHLNISLYYVHICACSKQIITCLLCLLVNLVRTHWKHELRFPVHICKTESTCLMGSFTHCEWYLSLSVKNRTSSGTGRFIWTCFVAHWLRSWLNIVRHYCMIFVHICKQPPLDS